jgi:hypothetical protein
LGGAVVGRVKADLSASLRNDKQKISARNDKQKNRCEMTNKISAKG